MSDCRPLEELLFEFFLYHYPAVLQEEDLFDRLLHLIHGLLRRAAQAERDRALARIREPSPC